MQHLQAFKGVVRVQNTTNPIGTQYQNLQRVLPNGMVLTAVSELAKQDWDPQLVVDELERRWKEGHE